MAEIKGRDLTEDLAICEAATPRQLWAASRDSEHFVLEALGEVVAICKSAEFSRFVAEARTGWPEAIRRAMDAEKRLMAAERRVTELEEEAERLRREFDELYAEHVAVRDRIDYERGVFRYD